MWIFFKAQISSLSATLVDFLAMIFLVEVFKLHYVEATIVGAITGAFTNFFINKYWSFESSPGDGRQQGLKYVLVWVGSVLLNTFGIYMLTDHFGIGYIVSKIVVAIAVGIAFNYTLQKHYVFARNEKAAYK